jgi:hypothetical protein
MIKVKIFILMVINQDNSMDKFFILKAIKLLCRIHPTKKGTINVIIVIGKD